MVGWLRNIYFPFITTLWFPLRSFHFPSNFGPAVVIRALPISSLRAGMWLKLCQLGLESYDRKRETKTVGVVLCSWDGVLSRPITQWFPSLLTPLLSACFLYRNVCVLPILVLILQVPLVLWASDVLPLHFSWFNPPRMVFVACNRSTLICTNVHPQQ